MIQAMFTAVCAHAFCFAKRKTTCFVPLNRFFHACIVTYGKYSYTSEIIFVMAFLLLFSVEFLCALNNNIFFLGSSGEFEFCLFSVFYRKKTFKMSQTRVLTLLLNLWSTTFIAKQSFLHLCPPFLLSQVKSMYLTTAVKSI